MDGDVAPLKDIVDAVHELLPRGNGHLIVDEAHSNGVLGPNGRGLVSQLGLEDEVLVRLHTFGPVESRYVVFESFSIGGVAVQKPGATAS